jgi:hypothetical protein
VKTPFASHDNFHDTQKLSAYHKPCKLLRSNECARRGSNPQPSDPKSDALSNCATGAHWSESNYSTVTVPRMPGCGVQ